MNFIRQTRNGMLKKFSLGLFPPINIVIIILSFSCAKSKTLSFIIHSKGNRTYKQTNTISPSTSSCNGRWHFVDFYSWTWIFCLREYDFVCKIITMWAVVHKPLKWKWAYFVLRLRAVFFRSLLQAFARSLSHFLCLCLVHWIWLQWRCFHVICFVCKNHCKVYTWAGNVATSNWNR